MSALELVLTTKEDLNWQDEGVCAQTDPDAFFPEVGQDASTAKRICRSCPVRDLCMQYALETEDEWAVMGGLTYKERMNFKKKRIRPTRDNIDEWIDRTLREREERRQHNSDRVAV